MANFITLPTAHPQKRGLLMWVKASVFNANPNIIPPKGTKLGDFPNGFGKDGMYQFHDYVYTRQGENNRDGDIGLYFAPPLTEEESNTPFDTRYRSGNHYWPAILKNVVILKARKRIGVERSGRPIYAPAYYNRISYIPSVQEGTHITTRKYIYNYEYDVPQHEAPVPTSVQWSLPGKADGSFPECLHGDIKIPAVPSEIMDYVLGEGTPSAMILQGQFFPATNFTSWDEYVKSDSVEFQNGVYIRTTVTVTPPPEPQLIIR